MKYIKKHAKMAMIFALHFCVNAQGGGVETYENVEYTNQSEPEIAWGERINAKRNQRLQALKAANEGVVYDLVMDFFRMGSRLNYYTSIGVLSNRIDVAVCNEKTIVTTNFVLDSVSEMVAQIREDLPDYRYQRHTGLNCGYMEVSAIYDNGIEMSRWFDKPNWSEHSDKRILESPMFRIRNKDEDTWRLFLRLYRKVMPQVHQFLRDQDWLSRQK